MGSSSSPLRVSAQTSSDGSRVSILSKEAYDAQDAHIQIALTLQGIISDSER